MKPTLRILWLPILVSLSAIAWAVLTGELPANSYWAIIVLALTAAWIVPMSVLIERDYHDQTVTAVDSFCFKLTCYMFGVPLVVIWANTMVFYLSQI